MRCLKEDLFWYKQNESGVFVKSTTKAECFEEFPEVSFCLFENDLLVDSRPCRNGFKIKCDVLLDVSGF